MKQSLIELIDLEEEKNRRRKEIELSNSLFNVNRYSEGDRCFYQQCIYNFIDNKYINCVYDFKEYMKAGNIFNKYVELQFNNTDESWISKTKRIYTDLEKNCFDLLNIDESYLIDNYK